MDPIFRQRYETLLLDLAREHELERVLELAVAGLTEGDDVALARVWVLRPGDRCDSCFLRDECPDRRECLHLVASSGRSRVEPSLQWSGVEGQFARFPVGVRKIGRIVATGEAMVVPEVHADSTWVAAPEWIEREGITSLVGQPLLSRGERIGVLAIFLRVTPCRDQERWLRMIADHLAAAISTSGAFREIESLRTQLALENEYLREEVRAASAFGDLIGQSAAMQNVARQIEVVAPTDANVLVLGESGTGKELVAREIHRRSHRAERSLVRVNCAAIPRDLFESEFFGHARGAFTGALADRVGRFELADGGTLFLDEVGEIPLELQGKLLRVLQEGQYERVGEDTTRTVDVRVIAATNRDLKQEADDGRFRQDLYYRLAVFPLELAPLRERPEDIPLLVGHFLDLLTREKRLPEKRLTPAALTQLQQYPWPGNIRELQNVLERALITSPGSTLTLDLPERQGARARDTRPPASRSILTESQMRQLERDNLRAALESTDWKVAGEGGAADLLGLRPTTLASRMKKLGLARPR